MTSNRKRNALTLAALIAGALPFFGCGPGEDVPSTASSDDALTASLPGTIEAENFRTGGEGYGYHDTTAGNSGGALRQTDVDIEACSDSGGGYDVGWIDAGEWLAYNVNVGSSGQYVISARLAAATPDARNLHVTVDGKTVASLSFAGGDGWQSWHTVTSPEFNLTSGSHVLKVVFDSAKMNLNWVEVKAAAAPKIFGMYNNTALPGGSEVNSASNYREIANKYFAGGLMKVHRVFNSNLPSTYGQSDGADDPAQGNVSFLSVKPPNGDAAGVAAGKYDATIRSLAASIPAGSYFTMYHEPEDNLTASQFVAMFRHFYAVAKAANPKLTIGYVAGAYQWRPGSSSTSNMDAWYPGADATDFLAVDAYDSGWSGAHSLDTQADFQRWYQWALGKNKPVVISEYGVEDASTGGFTDSERATIIQGSMSWLKTQPRIRMLLYWNGTSATPGGKNHYLNPTVSHPTDSFANARAAFVNGVKSLGGTGTAL